ncbi:MAG TPA: translation initiation factor IF-2 subunit alpha [Candidatus Thermoplasmatota archaeon]|nr:translation initiation factor IF-2 subunit alpha [Candidatus Thermoplasmatota archaeon]
MVKRKPFPEEGDLVVGTVKEVKGFGAFVTLDEYPGKEGFIHIAEVAAGWVKYVRDHVRENQKVVCKVISTDKSKGHVDLSLKRVNEHQRRETIAEWKNEQKADKLLEILAEKTGKKVEDLLKEFGYALVEAYGSLYRAFEEAAISGEDAWTEADLKTDSPFLQEFLQLARDNISIPFVNVKGYLDLTSPSPEGIEILKKALIAAGESEYEDVQVEVQYVGAPKYRLKVQAPDYKTAEEELRNAANRAIKIIEASGGTGEFIRTDEQAPKGGA